MVEGRGVMFGWNDLKYLERVNVWDNRKSLFGLGCGPFTL